MLSIGRGWTQIPNKSNISYLNGFITIIIIIIIGIPSLDLKTSYIYPLFDPPQALAQEEGGNFLTYENPRFGMTMQYPGDWEKKEYNTNPTANNTIVEFSGPSDLTLRTPLLSIFVYPSNGTILENAIDETIKDIENTRVNSSRLTTLENNTKAYLLNYTIDTAHAVFQKMQIWTEKSGFFYVITYTETPNRFKTNLPLVYQMLDSINIKPIGATAN
jgi:hypothetical protein